MWKETDINGDFVFIAKAMMTTSPVSRRLAIYFKQLFRLNAVGSSLRMATTSWLAGASQRVTQRRQRGTSPSLWRSVPL